MTATTILIVEDEQIVAANLSRKLARLGYTVCGSTECGEEALTLVQQHCPDLVLMDIRLAGAMDGVAAAELIRRECDVPVIYLTAHADRATLDRAKRTEPFGYILKPFDERELESHIEMALYKHQAERKLRASEARWRVTLGSIGDAVIASDTAGQVTFLNPVAAALTGWSPEEAQGQPFTQVFHIINELTHVPGEDLVARVLRENRVVELANHTALVTRDGREIPVEDSAAPITDAAGQVTGVVIVFHDVTEKRRAEEALQASEARFRSVLDNSQDCIYRFNVQTGYFGYISPSCESVVGYTADELRAHDDETALAMIHPDDLPAMRAAFARLEESGAVRVDYRQRAKNGDYRWIANHLSLIRDSAGQPLYRDGNIRDISERKQVEAERERLLEQQEIFVHLVSHDLRAPLTITQGYVGVLKDNLAGNANATVQVSIDAIARALKRMNVMIDDLTMAARLEGGQLPLARAELDLAAWLPAFLEHSARVLEVQRVQVELPETLPALAADADRLERILTNLLSNALKYSDPGTPVRLRVQPQAREVMIKVHDQGRGIAPAHLPHLFEKFYRADSSRKAEGIGLGLYITRLMVEAHGGRIWAESAVGQGSVFAFTLPVESDSNSHS